MSASAARIAANKANAQRSTGPRTPEGKARVSENALKHGLRSERNPLDLATDIALPFEREEFQSTLTAFLDDLAPSGPLETRLVERLAQIDLRLNRAMRMETTHLEMHMGLLTQSMGNALPNGEGTEQTRHKWLTTLSFLKNPSATTLIAQYESRLSRDFARTLAQFRSAQELRAITELENSRNQTQPTTMPKDPAATDPTTMPTQSPASNDRVAKTAASSPTTQPTPPIPAIQTQPAPQVIETPEHSTAAAS